MSKPDDPREGIQGQPPRRPAPARRPRDEEEDDDYDEEEPRSRRGSRGDGYSGVVPYRNGLALTAYYCGFVGLILILGGFALGIVLAPNVSPALIGLLIFAGGGIFGLLAIVFGILGLTYANRNPGAKGTAHAVVGLVFGVLEVLGLAFLFIIGFAAVARF